MNMFWVLLKSKLFYTVLVVAFIISHVIDFNETYNKDLLDSYYKSSAGVITFQDQVQPTLRDSLVTYSKLYLGKPYKFAAKGPGAFDCSGFTGYVFKNFNVDLPASSVLQSQFGVETKTENVQKGDLLIFTSPTKRKTVGHVGIVVSNTGSNIYFIHSSTSRGVIIDSLDHPYYKARYIGARNVLIAGNDLSFE